MGITGVGNWKHPEETGMAEDLSGKVALVTGASRGIGRAIALSFGRQGIHVAVNYKEKRGAAEEVCRQILDCGSRAVALQADVSSALDVDRMVEQARSLLGPILILVNNAGVSRPQPIAEIRERDWDEIIDANLKSHFLVTQAVLPDMRTQRWGRVINMSSVAAQLGGVIGPHYAASKAGIIGLTHSYAALLAREGITVNAIAPALIHTDMITGNPKARPDVIPLGRFGTVEETAEVAVMLAGNAYITGQTINVNGGWYMS
jgi:3-oxoacyl-[acyl-carrier protein] reductase